MAMSFAILCLKSNLASQLFQQAPEDTWISPGSFTIGDLAAGWAAFPDVAVMPESRVFAPLDRNVVTNPSILMEVTSDMTERVDRGIKFRLYLPGSSTTQDSPSKASTRSVCSASIRGLWARSATARSKSVSRSGRDASMCPSTSPSTCLELIARAVEDQIPGETVLVDSAYGSSSDFRNAVRAHGLDLGVAVQANTKAWPLDKLGVATVNPLACKTLVSSSGAVPFDDSPGASAPVVNSGPVSHSVA
jgi:hypothetical protein